MKVELLAPAGNLSKMKTAFYYGADACYLAGKKYGLRAFSDNFDENELEECIKFAHSLNKKVYVTVNILAHNDDFNGLAEYLQYLDKINADAIIVSDLGILSLSKEVAPNLEVHISTQANITNKFSAKKFVELGAKRLVLARELSIEEIKEIKSVLPKDVEIECFVHGAMCISYSGRCLLSNYFTGRDSNRGACVQACRWNYSLCEEHRKGEYFPILEDEKGTYILNSKDLNMLSHLKELENAGATSFKIEGRMKSEYYVATVVNAYRRAIDNVNDIAQLESELLKASHRKYTTGFYFNDELKTNIQSSAPVQTYEFMAEVLSDAKDGYVLVEQRNRFKLGDELEVLSPNETFNKVLKVEEIINERNEKIDDALLVQQKLLLKTDLPLKKHDMLRMMSKNIDKI